MFADIKKQLALIAGRRKDDPPLHNPPMGGLSQSLPRGNYSRHITDQPSVPARLTMARTPPFATDETTLIDLSSLMVGEATYSELFHFTVDEDTLIDLLQFVVR